MSESRYLDDFIKSIDENGRNEGSSEENTANANEIRRDDEWKSKILKATRRKLRKKRLIIRYVAVACIILAVLSSFLPGTPAFALRQTILSYIPGIGVVESTDEADAISAVLTKPVKVTDGESFLEIRSAYVKGSVLTVTAKTNAGIPDSHFIDKGNSKNIKDIMEFTSGESSPKLFLFRNGKKITAGQMVTDSYSLSSKTYHFKASFCLEEAMTEKDIHNDTFQIEMEGFSRPAILALSSVKSGNAPEEVGNTAVIDDVMIFAHASREKEILEVLVSIVAPGGYKHPRTHLFDHEKKLFQSGIYLTDQSGTRYEPDDRIRRERDNDVNAFYFHVPKSRDGLTLTIPQILFSREYEEENIEFTMPKANKDIIIDRKVQMDSHTITLKRASFLPAGSGYLPDDFRVTGCLAIDTGGTIGAGSRDSILRIIPDVRITRPSSLSDRGSQSIHAEFWDPEKQDGTAFILFDHMPEAKTIRVNFQAEFSMTGPWEISLEE